MELGDKNSQKGVKVKDGKKNHVHPAVFIYARRKRVGLLRCSPSHTHTSTHTHQTLHPPSLRFRQIA